MVTYLIFNKLCSHVSEINQFEHHTNHIANTYEDLIAGNHIKMVLLFGTKDN